MTTETLRMTIETLRMTTETLRMTTETLRLTPITKYLFSVVRNYCTFVSTVNIRNNIVRLQNGGKCLDLVR